MSTSPGPNRVDTLNSLDKVEVGPVKKSLQQPVEPMSQRIGPYTDLPGVQRKLGCLVVSHYDESSSGSPGFFIKG